MFPSCTRRPIRNLPKGLRDLHLLHVCYGLYRVKSKLLAVLLSSVCLSYVLFHSCLFSSLWGLSVSANGLGEVTIVPGVLRRHSHAVGCPGFESRLCVKITLHSSHLGHLIGRCLLDHKRVLRRVHHRPPLDRNGQAAHFYDEHFWCFQACQNEK